MTEPQEPRLNPVTYEILEHKLWQITNEMATTLTRVTGSPITTEAKDYITALCRADGDLIMSGCGVLYHAVTLPYAVKYLLSKYSGDRQIAEGDVFAINDPYICSMHVPDTYVLTPIYYKGELVAWAGAMTHLMDTGGIDAGGICPRATEIWHEGVRLPGVKLLQKGEAQSDVWDIVLNMVREPGMVALDLRGMIACGRTGAQRLGELIAAYGINAYKALSEEVIRQAEMQMRARLLELPDGTWETRVYYDDDGMTERTYQAIIKMTKDKDVLTFDLTGTSEQAPSFINCGVKGAEAAIFGSVAPLIAYDMPWSQGIMRVINVLAPEGTLVNPTFPAACSLATIGAADVVMTGVQIVVGRMFMASDDYKEDFTAMWGPICGSFVSEGINQHGQFSVNIFMESDAAGMGARPYADGVNTGGSMYIPEVSFPNVETYELSTPVLYLYRREATDSGGPGKWRGGAALEKAFILHGAPLGQLTVPHLGRGIKAPLTSGLFGGYPAPNLYKARKRNTNVDETLRTRVPQHLDELEGDLELLPATGVIQFNEGDVLAYCAHGGGGYGDPLDREPELVHRDVIDGYVSREAARDVYGVVIDDSNQGTDTEGTAAAREKIKATRLQAARRPE